MIILRNFTVAGVIAMLAGCAAMVPTQPGVMVQVLAPTAPGPATASAPAAPAADTTQAAAATEAAPAGVLVPRPLLPYVERDTREGLRNRVLNDMRAGLAAWDIGALKQSQALFADSFEQIEAIYADNPTAKLARSNWHEESVKDFKGEPYERAMVGYYRGLTEMALGDWDNARASFRWGEYQDTMSASEEYQSDMALLTFLKGWTNICTGAPSEATENFTAAKNIRNTLAVPARSDNLLLIAETTGAPVKYATGQYSDELRFKAGTVDNFEGVAFRAANKVVPAGLAEDLFFQASTRGGRPVDAILAGKASFKKNAETASKVASTAATVGFQVSQMQAAMGDYKGAMNSLGVSGLGLLASGISSGIAKATKPAADTRSWESLPDKIYVATATVKSRPDGLVASFITTGSQTTTDVNMRLYRVGQCFLAWARNTPVVAEAWNEQDSAAWAEVGTTDSAATSAEANAPAAAPTSSGGAKARSNVSISSF